MTRPPARMILPLLAALAAPALGQTPGDPPRPVVTEHAISAPAAEGVFVGTIAATTTVGVAFEVLGRMIARDVSEGDAVTKGQELARVDGKSLRDDRDAARAALASAEATLATARKSSDRARALVQRGTISPADRESAQRDEAVALARADQARAQLARAEDALSRAVLAAPMDGIVIETRYDPGTTVAAGDPVLVLASPTGRKVTLTLPAPLLQDARPGQPYRIRAADLPAGGIGGTLLRIDPVSVSDTRMRAAEIALGPEGDRLTIGQLVSVSPAETGGSRVALPAPAIWQRDGQPHVWRVEGTGDSRRVTAVAVTAGAAGSDGRVQVEGIAGGDEVVIRGVNSLVEGQAVGPSVVLRSGTGAAPRIITSVEGG